MSFQPQAERRHKKSRRALLILAPVLLIAGSVFGYQAYALASASVTGGSGTSAQSSIRVEYTISIYHQEQRSADIGWLAQMALKGQFWTPSCYVDCANGVTYSLDPTVLITSQGRDFEQCKVFGSAGTVTCTAADTAQYIGLSESSATPAATDTASSGPCKTTATANEIESGGLADVPGTVAAGPWGTTVTTTVVHTFTAAETDNGVQVACLQTEADSGSNVIIYAEGTFGPDSLVSGNTLTITWSISRA